jgi:hypothetical protein
MAAQAKRTLREVAVEVVAAFVVMAQAEAQAKGGEGKGQWVELSRKFGDAGSCVQALAEAVKQAGLKVPDDGTGAVAWDEMGLVCKAFKWGKPHVTVDTRGARTSALGGLRML